MRNDLCEEIGRFICWVANILAPVWMVRGMRMVQVYLLVRMTQSLSLMVLIALVDFDMCYVRVGFDVRSVDHLSKIAHPFL